MYSIGFLLFIYQGKQQSQLRLRLKTQNKRRINSDTNVATGAVPPFLLSDRINKLSHIYSLTNSCYNTEAAYAPFNTPPSILPKHI